MVALADPADGDRVIGDLSREELESSALALQQQLVEMGSEIERLANGNGNGDGIEGEGKIEYDRMGEEEYKGIPITMFQDSMRTPLRTGSNLPQGVGSAFALAEAVATIAIPFTTEALNWLFKTSQWTMSEGGYGVHNVILALSQGGRETYRGTIQEPAFAPSVDEEEKRW